MDSFKNWIKGFSSFSRRHVYLSLHPRTQLLQNPDGNEGVCDPFGLSRIPMDALALAVDDRTLLRRLRALSSKHMVLRTFQSTFYGLNCHSTHVLLFCIMLRYEMYSLPQVPEDPHSQKACVCGRLDGKFRENERGPSLIAFI